MNIQIITSSYPAFPGDPGGTAGLFVRSFAKELANQGHNVIVQPIARKESYQDENDLIIEPIPWRGGDQVLASLNLFHPKSIGLTYNLIKEGKKAVIDAHHKYQIDKTICMWIIPCGIFGYFIHKELTKSYDLWALGSDIWKIKKIPIFGKWIIRKVSSKSEKIFADGIELSNHTALITNKPCVFLPSSRIMPKAEEKLSLLEPKEVTHLLFVGRFHRNKGPDLLIEAISKLNNHLKKQIKVHMFGQGSMEKTLQELIKKHNLSKTIELNGPINEQDFANYLSRVSYFIIPSRKESIPLVFSDAMQLQIPVISTPVGDLTDLIVKHKCGLVSTKITSSALAKTITKAVKSTNKDYLQGTKNAAMEFDIKNIVRKWLQHNT